MEIGEILRWINVALAMICAAGMTRNLHRAWGVASLDIILTGLAFTLLLYLIAFGTLMVLLKFPDIVRIAATTAALTWTAAALFLPKRFQQFPRKARRAP